MGYKHSVPGSMIPLSPPYVPAISEAAYEHFESLLRPDSVVFEWGTGGSTLWLAQRVAHVVTVENMPEWAEEIRGYAQAEGLSNIQYLITQWEFGQLHRKEIVELYTRSILQFPDNYFDVVFSDGWDLARCHCAAKAVTKIKPGGWLVADDAGWNPVSATIKPMVESGWSITKRGGPLYCAWDHQSRLTSTAFLQKPGK